MDDEHSTRAATSPPAPNPHSTAAQSLGGTVEPASRARMRDRAQRESPELQAEHFELRDPTRDVTYRAKTLQEISTQAELLGASRLTAIHADGTRTPLRKIDGEWHRGDRLAARPKPAPDLLTIRDDVIDLSAGLEASLASTAKTAKSAARTAAQVAEPATQPDRSSAKAQAKIEAQAVRAAMLARIENALQERYIIRPAPIKLGNVSIGSTEYRFRGDSARIAFTESNLRLSTDTNSPSVARSMVDLSQARGWSGLRVTGADDFRRMVWLEASVRGVKTLGYEPNLGDLEILKREREARQFNRIEPVPAAGRSAEPPGTASPKILSAKEKSSARGGGRKAVIAAIDAILTEKKVPEAKRLAVLAAAEQQLTQMARRGQVPKIKVYDRGAERQVQFTSPVPDLSRQPSHQQERAAPIHVR